ncbi:AAA family ATPase [Acinetobacter shaoyimingii]|uniref:AAA family ATPase n=1 Tax=Acinetobacter shaoyimingii TaxID=2715164 RepID=A0A6G8RTH2_9GAMM|nr:AAA family ATPase [Acinetobacter shaoyimingii]QIO05226.1 AAA family ATPase [Acinetobacter shaoyimingii]
MKILSIRLKNLASLSGEHFIDFESEPLASSGLIAIVGKTGAGKSTILDAMCLALFNKIPRLKDSDGKLQDVDGTELLTNSPLTVLRRGTAQGFAELFFVAQDQKHYLARWEIKRSREKVDGKLQSVQRYLKCLTDGVVIADKAKAVDSSILKITQLSFEQFTRAVLLAQSEVTAFLKARDSERGELLEYLTNSSIFAKVGQLAYEKTKHIANQRKELENVLGHIEILSDDDLNLATTEFQDGDRKLKSLETEKTNLEKQRQWFERKQKLDSDIVLKQQHYDDQRNQQQLLQPEKQRLQQLEIFSGIRPMVFQKQQCLKAQKDFEPQILAKQKSFEDGLHIFNAEKALYIQAETALNQIQEFEQQHQHPLAEVRKCVLARDSIAEDYKKFKAKMVELQATKQPLELEQQQFDQQLQHLQQQHIDLQKEITQGARFQALDQSIHAHVQALGQFIRQYQTLEQQLQQHNLTDIHTATLHLKEQHQQLQLSTEQFGTTQQIEQQLLELRHSRDQHIEQFNQLQLMQQQIQQWLELHGTVLDLQQKLEHSTTQQNSLEQNAQQSEQAYLSMKAEHQQLIQLLQQQRLLHAENIEHLRAELKPDEPCVVCGSTEHPYRHNEAAVSKALYELQQQQEQQAEQKQQTAFQAWQQAQQALTRFNTEIEQLNLQLKNNQNKTENFKKALLEHAQRIHIELDVDQSPLEIEQQLRTYIQTSQQSQKESATRIQHIEQAHKQQYGLTQTIQQLENLLNNAERLQQHVQHIVDCCSETERQAWQTQTTATAQQILSLLQRRAEQLNQNEQLHKDIDVKQQKRQLLINRIEHLMTQIKDAELNLTEISEKGHQNNLQANQLIQQMTGLVDVKAHEWLTQHDLDRQQAQTHYHQLKQKFEQARLHHDEQKQALEQLKAQQMQNQQTLSQAQKTIEEWLLKHPQFDDTQLNALNEITSAQEQQIRQKIQSSERLFNETASALKTMQEQLAEHLLQQPIIQFEELNLIIQQNLDALQNQQVLRDQLKLKLDQHHANVEKQQKFATQIQAIQQEEHRWGKISGLMGDSTGKKFRDLAQQYNLDILIEHANQQLSLLSQRYTLKRLDNSLSLAIIDHDMDGEMRSVASLSGGESFLTALALSLAIANMASGSMKIESLFIDEGFGTLDASSLHMVMNALDQLQSQGRKVVLISHIQEMHERIPVQIQVRPLGAGASTIEIVS